MTIHKTLQNKEFRFCLIRKQSKAPYEKDWQNKGYKFDDPKLLAHLKAGNNYGVIGGYGNLRILDIDDKTKVAQFKKEFANTFMVETGSGGLHIYFISDYDINHVLKDGLGELRAKNYQCVGSGSIHPNLVEYKTLNDNKIIELPKEMLGSILKPYLREDVVEGETEQDPSGSGLEYRRIIALLKEGKTREQIFKKMDQYTKWATHGKKNPSYKKQTYERALKYVDEIEGEKKEEIILTDEETIKNIREVYKIIIETLRKFMDIKEEYYSTIAIWILGTYFHKSFSTYPYLYFNAMKGSGKTRVLKLIKTLSNNGVLAGSMSEAVLFRTAKDRTICIDEFEDLNNREKNDIKLLLNSAYKEGLNVERLTKNNDGKYDVESFSVYCPIAIANIWGMENTLSDRCITLILSKSDNPKITRLIENFHTIHTIQPLILPISKGFHTIHTILKTCTDGWNDYVLGCFNSVISVNSVCSVYSVYSVYELYNIINDTKISGRDLELFLPLFVMASLISKEVLSEVINTSKEIIIEKKEADRDESRDVQLIEFVSGFSSIEFVPITTITNQFRDYVDTEAKWLNTSWVGRALRRLDLVKEKGRAGKSRTALLDVVKAREDIKKFK